MSVLVNKDTRLVVQESLEVREASIQVNVLSTAPML